MDVGGFHNYVIVNYPDWLFRYDLTFRLFPIACFYPTFMIYGRREGKGEWLEGGKEEHKGDQKDRQEPVNIKLKIILKNPMSNFYTWIFKINIYLKRSLPDLFLNSNQN